MQQVSPLVKQIGELINVRFKTFETIIDGKFRDYENRLRSEIKASGDRITKNLRIEIKESEERVTRNLRSEIKESGDRVTKNLRAEIKESEDRATRNLTEKIEKVSQKLDSVEEKLDGEVTNHRERIERLERHPVIPA